ncbi:hypothetical protein AB0N09_21790 [Streptomyces erythrochromogenes]|uniref:hypothetical protein n=1 Tax=Streptomyces erythrochromogenes TaxID=285574 RepID=UPI00343BF1C7
MPAFTAMPHKCFAAVASAVEAYSAQRGQLHGSLDATAYVCPAHVQAARAMWEADRLTPYVTEAGGMRARCGAITDFRETAPAPEATGTTR